MRTQTMLALAALTIAGCLVSASAQTVYTGFTTNFTKSAGADWNDPANQDDITSAVIITRQDSGYIYNYASGEAGGSGHGCFPAGHPADTEWAFGAATDWMSLSFQPFGNWHGCTPPSMVGRDAVVHLISEDIYLDIRFSSWGAGGGGAFSYDRATIDSGGGGGAEVPSGSSTSLVVCGLLLALTATAMLGRRAS